MSKYASTMAIVAGLLFSGIPIANAQLEEVVVTGSRQDFGQPHVYIVKRADHLITQVYLTCDTRDENQRKEELKETLRNMMHGAAQSGTISLGHEDQVLGELSEANFDDIISPDTRPDTSKAYVIVKTTVSKTDTLSAATARIRQFVANTPKVGRTEITVQDRWDLTVIGPEQYRDTLVTQIVADSKRTAELFGPGYAITIDGLERPVAWFQKGPLELGLYLPYTLHIAPANAH